ncbi:hypothetical protein BDZ94DRAFT_250818 [Collybia nuda]|uniref:F-box domain-containing protein n=1 Tax=Collybia nuda TaxID=64659 RepID=A0A9P5YA42_9AGAR|nr:hypothetical protein BDZ94DRAFT_250818 [Collybia nuda]
MALILSLPVDVCLPIFHYLSVLDILRIRQTCKAFEKISHLRSVWHGYLRTRIQERNIPVPGLSQEKFESLSAFELEQCVRRALLLRKNWTSSSPVISSRLEIQALPTSRIIALEFLPGEERRWLISIASTVETTRKFTAQCWDLRPTRPQCIAIKEFPKLQGFAVNRHADNLGHLAVRHAGIEVLKIDLACTNPASAFVTTAFFPNKPHRVHVYQGSVVLTRDDHDRLYIWDIENFQGECELKNSEIQFEAPLEAVIQDTFVIIIRQTTLEIYGLPSVLSPGSVVFPIAVHRWQWKLDTVIASTQASWEATQSGKLSPINILVRYGSLLPWPLNVLHHYVLFPNMFYEAPRIVDPSNLPYHISPFLHRIIPSPIRLFSTYAMSIGSHGTAIWTDSHTEDYFDRADQGQRLAGSIRLLPAANPDNSEAMAPDTRVESTTDSMVFDVSEQDRWVRVTVDEEEGRIALGSTDGMITILNYA